MDNEIKTPEGGTLITMPIDQENQTCVIWRLFPCPVSFVKRVVLLPRLCRDEE